MVVWLILAVTVFYAGYNVCIRLSGGAMPEIASTTIFATITLQVFALGTSALFLGWQAMEGGHVFRMGTGAFLWAALAGICIGAAEIAYFYVFGVMEPRPNAGMTIAIIVGGTVLLSTLFTVFALGERMSAMGILGVVLVVAGLALVLRNAVPAIPAGSGS